MPVRLDRLIALRIVCALKPGDNADSTPISDLTIGTATGGDLSGSLPAPVVSGIQGVPVSATAPTSGQILVYSAGQWQPAADPGGPPSGPAGGDLSGTFPNPTVAKVNGVAVTGTPSVGMEIIATGATTATWQAVVASSRTFAFFGG